MDVNRLITKVTWRVEILSAVHSLSKSLGVNGQITKVTWRVENFSSIKDPKLYSENFSVCGHKWRLVILPKGNDVDRLSIYLDVVDSATLPSGWSTYVQIGLAVINRFDRELSITKVSTVEFTANDSSWGFPSLLALSELRDPKRGYLVNDVCLLEAYVSTDTTKGLISHELMIKTDSDRQKTDEADSSTQFRGECEAKEALTTLEEALDMTPVHFYGSREFSSLKQAFKILACFDCSSTALTIEQKNELLGMEQSLKELVSQAAKASRTRITFLQRNL
ncbi:hypothetical protein Golob_004733 [Gossypium lobatum]|uniref:MATH domain-containing protein n=1 Tax=Gossypium lobatum TaxID=34289 RepID=A0A7J8N2M6_9ROSI|nr:hypothetical protein [Gossypium lobatum]